MGRPKTPTAILEFKGAYKKNPQWRREAEPQPVKLISRPLPHLDKDQRKAWRDILRQCHPGVITQMDRAGLEIAARGLAYLRTTKEFRISEQRGVFFMLGKFGMTPSDRASLIGCNKPRDGGFRPTRFQSLNPERDRRK